MRWYITSLVIPLIFNLMLQVIPIFPQGLIPLSPDIQVDDELPQNSGIHSPAITINKHNKIMIVWAEEIKSGHTKLFGKIFNAQGEPLTAEFRIDQSSDESSTASGNIDIATDTDGNFYIVWEDSRKERDYQIFARAFSDKGKAISKEISVEADADSVATARAPAIAVNQQNVALIAWILNDQRVKGRCFQILKTGALEPLTAEVRIDQNPRQSLSARHPFVAAAPDDQFVVTWVDSRTEFAAGQGTPLVFARQLDSQGNFLGNDFRVNDNVPTRLVTCLEPSLAIDANKNMIFCWNDGRQFNQNRTNFVYSRRLSWNQVALSGDIAISACILNDRPAIAVEPSANFTIVYSQSTTTQQDPQANLDHVFARQFDPNYQPVNPVATVDQGGTVYLNTQHDLAMDRWGRLFTTWIQNVVTDTVNFTQQGHLFFNIYGAPPISGPSNLTAVDTSTNEVTWQWEWSGDSTLPNLNFYLKDENNSIVSPLIPIDLKNWQETGLNPNTKITRLVFTVQDTIESLPSNAVTLFTHAEAPRLLKKNRATENSVTLSWVEENSTRFAVERADDIAGQPVNWRFLVQWSDSLTTAEFEDRGLKPLTSYWYRIRSYNGDGIITSPSTPLRITTEDIVLVQPTAFSGKSHADSSIQWQWQDNSNNETGYFLLDAEGNRVSDQLPADSTEYVETNLNPNTFYIRRVIGIGETGKLSQPSNWDTTATLASPPTNIAVAETSATRIRLKWQAENASAFRIERAEDQQNQPGAWQVLKSWEDRYIQTSFQDLNLVPNSIYWYRVWSYNQVAEVNQNYQQIVAKTDFFAGPTHFKGIAKSVSEITWQWRDNSEDEVGFQVLSFEGDTLSAILPVNTSAWTEKGLQANQPYIRLVQIIPPPGQDFLQSNRDTVFTLAFPSDDLKIIRFQDRVLLGWRGHNASFFAIERAQAVNETTSVWLPLAQFIADSTFQDTTIESNQSYWYRVFAFNGDGIRTSACDPVLASALEVPARRGDLNNNQVLDLADLNRLIEIVLEKGAQPTYHELYTANFYNFDEAINIHDIMALIDSLLTNPYLFRSVTPAAGHSLSASLNVVNQNGPARVRLNLNKPPQILVLALELGFESDENFSVEVTSPTADSAFKQAILRKNTTLRVINYHFDSQANETADFLPIEFAFAAYEKLRVTLHAVQILDSEGNLIQVSINSERLDLINVSEVTHYQLAQNYPNPFNSQTVIRMACPKSEEKVSLVIFNLLGQKICTLIENQALEGIHHVKWDGKDDAGQEVPSGIYLYQLSTGSRTITRKLILID